MGQNCSCTVSFLDSEQIRHSVEVTAESLFEASVLALAAFKASKLTDCAPGAGAQLEIKVASPAVTHTISVRRVQSWLESAGKSPREQALKARLQAALDGKSR